MSEIVVKSASRVFQILENFQRVRRPLRLKDVASMLGSPTSSTAALLKSMATQGYLSFDANNRTYIPTARIAQLVSWLPAASTIDGAVLEMMHRLRDRAGELIVLAAEADIYLDYVETLRSREGIQLYLPPGTKRILIQTGTGWLLLSRRSREEAVDIYERTMAQGALLRSDYPLERFLQHLEENRDEEISFVRARDLVGPVGHWGGAMVSAVLPIQGPYRSLSIGVGGPVERIEEKYPKIRTYIQEEIQLLKEQLAE